MPRNLEDWNKEYATGAHWEREYSPQAVEFAKHLKPGAKVLDAGCGSGRDSLFLASQGFDVTGVDISDVGIQKAQVAAEAKGLKATFAVGNLEHIDLADKTFDGVYSGYTLQETDLEKSIAELARVSKQGAVARLALLERTNYEVPNDFDENLDHEQVMAIIGKHFTVDSQSSDEYEESDQYGKHKHVRLILQLTKK